MIFDVFSIYFKFAKMSNNFLNNPFYDFHVATLNAFELTGLHIFEYTKWYSLDIQEKKEILKKHNFPPYKNRRRNFRIELQYEVQDLIIIVINSNQTIFLFDLHIDLKNSKQYFKYYEFNNINNKVDFSKSIEKSYITYKIETEKIVMFPVSISKYYTFSKIFKLTKINSSLQPKYALTNDTKNISCNVIEIFKDYEKVPKNNINLTQLQIKKINKQITKEDKFMMNSSKSNINKDFGKYVIFFIVFLLILLIIIGNIIFIKKTRFHEF